MKRDWKQYHFALAWCAGIGAKSIQWQPRQPIFGLHVSAIGMSHQPHRTTAILDVVVATFVGFHVLRCATRLGAQA